MNISNNEEGWASLADANSPENYTTKVAGVQIPHLPRKQRNAYGNWKCNVCGLIFRTRKELSQHRKKFNHFLKIEKSGICQYCGTELKTKRNLIVHERHCRLNPNYIKGPSHSMKPFADKISKTAKQNGLSGGLRHGSGRGKKGRYKGFWCDSSWELAFVIWCLDNNKQLIRNLDYFNYEFEGKKHKYYPDFILDGVYYEIKGRKRGFYDEQTKAKISQFKKELIIIDNIEIKQYLNYVFQKYGKHFIDLYD